MSICKGLDGNLNAGSACNPGQISAIFLFEKKPAAISESAAAMLATYVALILKDAPGRMHPLTFKIAEPTDPTITEETFDDGSTYKISEQKSADVLSLIATECSLNTIYGNFRSNKEMYAVYVLANNVLEYKKGATAGTVESIKVNVYSSWTATMKDKSGKVRLHVQPLEQYKQNVKYIGDLDFDANSLSGVSDLTFTEYGVATTTALTVEVVDCSGTEITDLATGAGNFFKIHNVTDNAAVVVTGATRVGNRYTLAFAAQAAAEVLAVYYDSPSVTDEKYELLQANALSVTIPT